MMRLFSLAVFAASLLAGPALANGVAEPLVISLPGNPSTGYSWALDAAASTGLSAVKVESLGFGPPESALIGAPAPFLFAVTCTGAGEAVLVFAHIAPSGAAADETESRTVTCE